MCRKYKNNKAESIDSTFGFEIVDANPTCILYLQLTAFCNSVQEERITD